MVNTTKTIEILQQIRRELRAKSADRRGERTEAAGGYRAAIADAVKIVNRAIRRSADGRGA